MATSKKHLGSGITPSYLAASRLDYSQLASYYTISRYRVMMIITQSVLLIQQTYVRTSLKYSLQILFLQVN
jgi:hypothetical protein